MLIRKIDSGATLSRSLKEYIRPTRDKLYKVECSLCSKDTELYPDPFWMSAAKFRTRVPCGCSAKPEWSTYQKEVLIRRRCKELGYYFLGWKLKGKSRYLTKDHMRLYNPASNNIWDSFTFTDFITAKYTDPKIRGKGNLRPDSYHITKFMATGAYSLGTIFTRSDRVDSNGAKNYWKVSCGCCKVSYEMFTGNLNRGQVGCCCKVDGGFKVELPSYIYIVRWYGYCESYLKFGITNREIMDRISEQDTESKHLDYEILHTFYHESGQAVWDCEKLIKQSVQTSVCPKELLPDGYTETTNDTPEVLQQMLNIIEDNL